MPDSIKHLEKVEFCPGCPATSFLEDRGSTVKADFAYGLKLLAKENVINQDKAIAYPSNKVETIADGLEIPELTQPLSRCATERAFGTCGLVNTVETELL